MRKGQKLQVDIYIKTGGYTSLTPREGTKILQTMSISNGQMDRQIDNRCMIESSEITFIIELSFHVSYN